MIPRPKNTDTMDDVLKMQNDYLKRKHEENLKPAAQAISQKDVKKQSLFAKQRNLKKSDEVSSEREVVSDVFERKYHSPMEIDDNLSFKEDSGFPKPISLDLKQETLEGKSLFSQMMATSSSQNTNEWQRDIHEENLKLISEMSLEEIVEERERLKNTMDPKLVEFLRSRQKGRTVLEATSSQTKEEKKSNDLKMIGEIPALEFLNDGQEKNWLNMNVIEPEKLEWTRNVEELKKVLKPGESYEARFDWKGFLLPYSMNSEENKDDRELYLHGEDTHRPGYTLQELFRLARSTVLQQRISAINAIAGILNIYSQGFYDGILELPISKIFFFVRFALDENTTTIIEATTRALSSIFYNETDETLLDILFETRTGFIQPLMNNRSANEKSEDFEEIAPSRKLFESYAEDFIDSVDEREKESVNDFHMAEVNLVECLMRTNIIERISYILITTKPNEITTQNCLKLLIRIARTSEEFAMKIASKRNLMEYLMASKIEPTHLLFKLYRVLASYNITVAQNLYSLGVVMKAKTIVSTRQDINVQLIKIQIESFRFLRIYYQIIDDVDSFSELLMPIRYLLEWHYQNLVFNEANHFIIRSHASALLHLLACSKIHISFEIFAETFKMCCSKWFHMAYQHGVNDFSQKMLLSSSLDVMNSFIAFAPGYFYEFIDNYLLKFMSSQHFQSMQKNLVSSPLLRHDRDRSDIYKPLINLGSIVESPPTMIYTPDYSVILMDSLLNFIDSLEKQNNNSRNSEFSQKLKSIFITKDIANYLIRFSSLTHRPSLAANWYMRTEIRFIFKLLMSLKDLSLDASASLRMAFNLLNCLTCDNFLLALVIFEECLFKQDFYGDQIEQKELDRWKFIFNGVISSRTSEKSTKYPAVIEEWNVMLLNKTWTYSLLMILFYNAEINTDVKRIVETELSEKEIIIASLKFNKLLDSNGIKCITPDQEIMYLMLIYLGKDLDFLHEDVKLMISERLSILKNCNLKLNQKLNNEKSFENLFTMFLDFFQANSYGDTVFSTLLMIPLAQKYDVKWRKLVWSEYAAVLKFITCDKSNLNFEEYFEPLETDVSLLKNYNRALRSNWLKQDSLPWKIANHHLKQTRKS